MTIAENVALVRENMDRAALAAGRDPKEILLLAATKMNDADRVRQAIAAGVDLCGENRVQEMLEKQAQGAYAGVPLGYLVRKVSDLDRREAHLILSEKYRGYMSLLTDRKSTRLNSSHPTTSRMPSSA